MKETIAVDLDKTLAKASGKWLGNDHIGEPIPAMVNRVKEWLKSGKKVVIFTARAKDPDAIPPIREWCKEHLGQVLPVTNAKSPEFKIIYDDRAISVEKNTGKILTAGRKAKRMALA